jgi:hypothetical protein
MDIFELVVLLASTGGGAFALGFKIGHKQGLSTVVTESNLHCEVIKSYNDQQGGRGKSTRVNITLSGGKRSSVNCSFIDSDNKCSLLGKKCRYL